MGNQMFSYAFARKLQLKNPGQKIVLDFSNFEHNDESWMNYLNQFRCKENLNEGTRHMNLIQKGILWLYYNKQRGITSYSELRAFEERYADLLEWFGLYIYTNGFHQYKYKGIFKNKLLIGFFESAEYFDDIAEKIRTDFSVRSNIYENPDIAKLIEDIREHVSVAVGVRRGDFVSKGNKDVCDVCTSRYYEKAIDQMKNLVGGMEFKVFCFSDDIEWVRNNINISVPVQYVTSSVHGLLKPWEMLQIMSTCKYQIISNSSFFWWGQYLNTDKEKIVIAPDRWRNIDSEVYRDIYQPNWLCIDPGEE